MVVALDRLQEQRRPVLHDLGEDLQQVTLVVVVDQDVQLLGKPDSINGVGGGAGDRGSTPAH